MTELISHGLTCRGCGTPLVKKPGGGKPTYCPSCVTERTRIANRDAARRRAAGVKLEPERFPCAGCDKEIVWAHRGPRPERCPDCAAARTRNYIQAYQRERGHQQSGAVLTVACVGCDGAIEWTVVVGRRPWLCDECKRKSYLATAPQRRARNNARRARIYGVGYELFEDTEIFERDRWMCGICSKRIRRNVKWPNRMAATIDHIIPISQGGPHSRANVRAAHYSCNSSRNNRGGNEQLALLG